MSLANLGEGISHNPDQVSSIYASSFLGPALVPTPVLRGLQALPRHPDTNLSLGFTHSLMEKVTAAPEQTRGAQERIYESQSPAVLCSEPQGGKATFRFSYRSLKHDL